MNYLVAAFIGCILAIIIMFIILFIIEIIANAAQEEEYKKEKTVTAYIPKAPIRVPNHNSEMPKTFDELCELVNGRKQ